MLGASAVAAATAATGLAATVWMKHGSGQGSGPSFPELLRQVVLDLALPCNSAQGFLSSGAGADPKPGIPELVASVGERIGMNGRSAPGGSADRDAPDAATLVRLLARAVKDDFAANDLCLVDGWQLSMTECRLAALKLLWEREEHGEAPATCLTEPLHAIAPPPRLTRLVPERTFVGTGFTVQPNGKSVINIYGADFQPGARILMGDVVLDTAVGHSGWVNAYVPPELYSRERVVDVAVRNPDGTVSNVIKFEIDSPAAAQPPVLAKIVPHRTPVGVPFTVQPNGKSVINVYGAGFRTGAEILFDDSALDSSVGDSGWMNAYVPSELYAREDMIDVSVRNPDGQVSNVLEFEIASGGE